MHLTKKSFLNKGIRVSTLNLATTRHFGLSTALISSSANNNDFFSIIVLFTETERCSTTTHLGPQLCPTQLNRPSIHGATAN